jgi:hypothetical protein
VDIAAVTAFTRPYDYWYDQYQTFYREGLRRSCVKNGIRFNSIPMTRLPRALRTARRMRRYLSHLPGQQATAYLDRFAHAAEGPVQAPSFLYHNSVGQYLVDMTDGTQRRICIDAADYPTLRSQDLVSWADFYFKANYWPSETYPENVRRIINGDPLILRRIPSLRTYRAAKKKFDVCFVVRVRGGANDDEGIEHNLRLLEAVNRVQCSKFIFAYLVAGNVEADARRLRAHGISSSTRSLRSGKLWRAMGESSLNIIRLGMHYCLPWRMAGALAMGASVALDQPPRASWPTPLREAVNFLSLGAETIDSPVAKPEAYDAIPELIETWLSDRVKLKGMMAANARYFDEHVDPECVGDYIVQAVSPG